MKNIAICIVRIESNDAQFYVLYFTDYYTSIGKKQCVLYFLCLGLYQGAEKKRDAYGYIFPMAHSLIHFVLAKRISGMLIGNFYQMIR